MEKLIWNELWDDENVCLPYKMPGVGSGHTKSGKRRKWKKRHRFELDHLKLEKDILVDDTFQSKFAGCTVDDIQYIWNKIKKHVVLPRETEVHARNELMMWLDKLHNDLSWVQISVIYQIGISTAIKYSHDLLKGMIQAYQGSDIISFPAETEMMQMVKVNQQRGKRMPHALYSLDGKHAKCRGLHFKHRKSKKYKCKIPCFNVLFVVERTFGSICAFNLDESSRKNDIRVLRESHWFQNLQELTDGWIIMADKGYVGIKAPNIAFTLKANMKREKWSPQFWHELTQARADSERVFAHFFVNKFKQLANWPGKGKKAFKDWALNVTCGIIVYNELKFRHAKLC